MKTIKAKIEIYRINDEELSVGKEKFLQITPDGYQGHLIHLMIEEKWYAVEANDLIEAINRVKGFK